MNEGIHLDLDTWIVPGQIRKANLCRGLTQDPGNYIIIITRNQSGVTSNIIMKERSH